VSNNIVKTISLIGTTIAIVLLLILAMPASWKTQTVPGHGVYVPSSSFAR